MSLLDLFVVLVVLLFAFFAHMAWPVLLVAVGCLIIERLLIGERFPSRRP